MKNYEKCDGWLPSRQSGPTGANHGTQETSRAPKMAPKHPNCSTEAPKMELLNPRDSQNGASESSRNRKMHPQRKQNTPNLNYLGISNLQKKIINIASTIVKLYDPLLPMLASTLLGPPILSAKMSACPFWSETSWSSHFSLGW